MQKLGSESEFYDEELSAEEKDFYHRQFNLEGWSQKIIKNSRILIVGVGGLGCEIAKNLAMIGIGHLDLVDLDIIEHSNLSRQVLYKPGDEGRPKVEVAIERLKEMNPYISINGYYCSLERLDPAIYKAADVIIGALDSRKSRVNLNAHSIRFKKPLVEGGVGGYLGYVYTNFPYENACSSEIPRERILRKRIPRKRIHCILKAITVFKEKNQGTPPDPKNNGDIIFIQNYANELVKKYSFSPPFIKEEIVNEVLRNPQLITTIAVISAFQAHQTIKILHWLKGNKSIGEPIRTFILYNAMTMQLFPMEIKRDPNCLICGENVKRVNTTKQ